ncbi:hypothetical protein JOB18_043732 [Solea senegalensis]|uniref:Uncharacterized protein n=1 Tax=Solea senegalensis TaxID=28829 RepID=A0AAV6SWP0_SOLSE|nr:hypothetical protein JOB18_043732 [Solea senegalensis]
MDELSHVSDDECFIGAVRSHTIEYVLWMHSTPLIMDEYKCVGYCCYYSKCPWTIALSHAETDRYCSSSVNTRVLIRHFTQWAYYDLSSNIDTLEKKASRF